MRRRSSWRHSFWYLPQSARTLLLLFARLLSHLLLRSGRRHSVLADGAQSTRVSFAFILERYRPLPSTAFRQFAQLLERLKGCSIGCLQWETETVPANKHVTAGLLDCADSRPIAISTIPEQQVLPLDRYSPVGLPAMFISQLEKIAIQVRQAQSVMHTPVGPRTTLLFNIGGIHHSHSALRTHAFHNFLLANCGHSRVETPQPRLARSESLEQRHIRNIGDGLLPSTHDGLAQRQTCRCVHKNQLQQAVGTGNVASPPQRARLSRLFAPIFWKQFRKKFPFFFQQINRSHASC